MTDNDPISAKCTKDSTHSPTATVTPCGTANRIDQKRDCANGRSNIAYGRYIDKKLTVPSSEIAEQTSSKAQRLAKSMLFLRPDQLFLPMGTRISQKDRNTIIRMAHTIQKYGFPECVTVRSRAENTDPPRYEIAQGELLWQAARLSGCAQIPCVVLAQSENEAQKEAILAQIRQKTTDFFAEAALFHRLCTDFGMSRSELAHRLGLSPSAVANKLRLSQFSPEEQRILLDAGLSERHARAFLRLKDTDLRIRALSIAACNRPTVAACEQWVEQHLSAPTEENEALLGMNSPPKTLKTPQNATFHPQIFADPPTQHDNSRNPQETSLTVRTVVTPSRPRGIIPQKFAMQSLQPLYNSIERTLSIFRKSGRTAIMAHEEGPNGILITINIPAK